MIPTTPSPCVAAAIATYRRDAELKRLLEALRKSDIPLSSGIHVADNASSEETRTLCDAFPEVTWLPRPVNNGPGPAWNTAIEHALQNPAVTHVLVLDDDVVPPPDTVRLLLSAMTASGAAAAAPLLFDEREHLWGFPEPSEKALRLAIRRATTPAECRRALGDNPHAFCWATGACMLYTRNAWQTCGVFREDFWMLGEDLELSMRVAAALGGVFTAQAAVPHLPPPPHANTSLLSHRLKFLALLQNLSCLAFHSPHSAHLRRYLAGNFKRYARNEGLSPGTLWDGWCAFYQGALCRQPAGTPAGARLRERATRRLTRP
jgi:cellulose synthase/poly-beta-1,6-N-acetylglucosamine synthase-like glycosyltransferase